MKKQLRAYLVGLTVVTLGTTALVHDAAEITPTRVHAEELQVVTEAALANLGVPLGSPSVAGQTVNLVANLDQVTVRTVAIENLQKLRGEMWDRNPPYNGSTLQQVAAANGLKTRDAYVNGIQWDTELEKFAIQRAVEAGIVADHIRPDGSQYGIGYENLAWGYDVASAVYSGWGVGELNALISANGAWDYNNGHLHTLLNPTLKSFAVGQSGATTAGAFGRRDSTNTAGTGLTGQYTVPVKFSEDYLTNFKVSLDKTEYTVGERVKLTVTYREYWTIAVQPEISNTAVVGNDFVARSAGTVTFTVGGKSVTAKVGTYKSVYRLYDKISNQHFYTSNQQEVSLLQSRGWRLEGTAWKVPIAQEGTPIYRLWNTKTGERLFTRHYSEVTTFVARGWKNEGVAFYGVSQGQAIYRLRNTKTGRYLLTVGQAEVAKLVATGQWKNEGIAWYGIQ